MRLDAHLGDLEAFERRQALRALLACPLITAASAPDEFRLVRRHTAWLREWFDKHPRWLLSVDVEAARLFKVSADTRDATRGARDPKHKTPLSRRAYMLFCLAAAALEKRRQERQTTLGELAKQIGQMIAIDERLVAVGFDLEQRGHRRDLVCALRLLAQLGILYRVEGREEEYVQSGGERDVLYGIRRHLLTMLLASRRGPSTIETTDFETRLTLIIDEPHPDTAEGRNRRIRSQLTRRLLDDPVLYVDSLSDDAREYFSGQRAHLCRSIAEATGLLAEVRKEGVALVDEGPPLSDRRMPEEGTDGHLTVLLAEVLAKALREREAQTEAQEAQTQEAQTRSVELGWATLERYTATLAQRYKSYWRRDSRVPGAEVALCRGAIARLCELSLVRTTSTGVIPLAAIGRFAHIEGKQPEEARR